MSVHFKETVSFYWESKSSHLLLDVRDQIWRVKLSCMQSSLSREMLSASLQKGSLFFPTQVHLSHLHKTLMATECLVKLSCRQRDQVKSTCGSPYPAVSSLKMRALSRTWQWVTWDWWAVAHHPPWQTHTLHPAQVICEMLTWLRERAVNLATC